MECTAPAGTARCRPKAQHTNESEQGMNSVPHYRMYVDGQWRDSTTVIEVRSPATNELIATVAQGDLAAADAAVSAARAADVCGVWRSKSPSERADLLDAIADNLAARAGELTTLQVH